MLQYGPTLKRYRALLHQELNNRAAMAYLPVQYQEVRNFMIRLIESPKDFLSAARLSVTLLSFSLFVKLIFLMQDVI